MIFTPGSTPQSRATRSDCRPAQLISERASRAPTVVSTTSPLPHRWTPTTLALVRTSPPAPGRFGERAGHGGVVDDAGFFNAKAGDPSDGRLEPGQLVWSDPPQARQPVGPATPLQLIEGRQLVGRGGHHELAAAVVRDGVLPAEPVHRLAALDAVGGLQRPRLVVQAEWMTPLLWPVWWAASASSASSTTTRGRPGRPHNAMAVPCRRSLLRPPRRPRRLPCPLLCHIHALGPRSVR